MKGNWYKAYHYCYTHGMRLATIESKEESDKITLLLNGTGYKNLEFRHKRNVNLNVIQFGLKVYIMIGDTIGLAAQALIMKTTFIGWAMMNQ